MLQTSMTPSPVISASNSPKELMLNKEEVEGEPGFLEESL
jgi:hypothetical protein